MYDLCICDRIPLSQDSVSLEIENDLLSDMTKPTLLESLSQDYDSLEIDNELLSNKTKFTLLDSLRQDSNAKAEFNVLSNTTKLTFLELLSPESDFVVNALSNTTTFLESLSQDLNS